MGHALGEEEPYSLFAAGVEIPGWERACETQMPGISCAAGEPRAVEAAEEVQRAAGGGDPGAGHRLHPTRHRVTQPCSSEGADGAGGHILGMGWEPEGLCGQSMAVPHGGCTACVGTDGLGFPSMDWKYNWHLYHGRAQLSSVFVPG